MGDYRTTRGEPPPVPPRTRRRRFWRRLLLVICFLGSIVAAGIVVKVDRYVTATGYVTTREYAEVRPATMGTVAEILKSWGEISGPITS